MKDTIYRDDAIDCVTYDEEYTIERLKELPPVERTVAHIQDFTQYQIDWLTEHDDLELEPELESWVIRFLKDTADCYEKEYLTSAERKGKWLRYGEDGYPNEEDTVFWQCDQCLEQYTGRTTRIPNYCPNCGARMVSEK